LTAAIQSELRRFGPLPACLGLDAQAFGALRRGGKELVVSDTDEGVFYTPHSMAADVFQAVLIVGYKTSPVSSYWILRSSHSAGPWGYTLLVGGEAVDGLVNLSMADGREALARRVLSAQRILVASDGGSPRPPGAGDPFVRPKLAAALVAAPRQPVRKTSPTWWLGLLLAIALAVFCTLYIIKKWDPSASTSE
jgi:hypothetical protein